jgi:glycine betaine/proline transport system ATP-binding protein
LIQLATAEDMVLNPADDYVRAFTKNAPREHIVTLARIMKPAGRTRRPEGPALHDTMKIGDAAATVLASDRPLPVVDGDGLFVGTVDRPEMIAALFPGDAS